MSKLIAYTFFVPVGALFVFCVVTGRELAAAGNILWTAGNTFRILGISLAVGGALGALVCALFYRWLGRGNPMSADEREEGLCALREDSFVQKMGKWLCGKPEGRSAWNIYFGSLLLTFLMWLPAFLAYYPAICAYDMPVQMEQILSGSYIDHHPIAHTLLIKWSMDLGESVFGSVNTGIGCYALLQMVLLAAVFALGVCCLYRRGVKRLWLILLQLFCMLYPFHMYMSVSVTKDTIFSAFFLAALFALSEISEGMEGRRCFAVLFFAAGIGMILFRNNGRYAFLVLLLFLLAAAFLNQNGRIWRSRIFLLAVCTFLAGNLALSGIFKAVDAEQGDKREMLSIPIQQLSRTMLYHGGIGVTEQDDGAMSDTDRALINDFILEEAYKEYRADFTDPVKRHTNTYVARYRAKEFLAAYVGLFLQFPGEYLNAVLAVDAGYLYPGDVSHAYINMQEGNTVGLAYVQTRWDEGRIIEAGIFKDSKWPALRESMEKWANDNAYLAIPVIKYMFVPGVWIWLYLLLAGWFLIRREFAECIPLILVFGYFLTLLLGPAVQLRYLYPVMAAFPFLFVRRICTH